MAIQYHTHVSTKIPLDQFEDEDFVTKEYVDSNVGNGAGRFEFEQSAPDIEWSIQHMLGQRIVAVQVLDDGGTTVFCDIDYDSINRCILTFAKPKAGTAIVRR